MLLLRCCRDLSSAAEARVGNVRLRSGTPHRSRLDALKVASTAPRFSSCGRIVCGLFFCRLFTLTRSSQTLRTCRHARSDGVPLHRGASSSKPNSKQMKSDQQIAERRVTFPTDRRQPIIKIAFRPICSVPFRKSRMLALRQAAFGTQAANMQRFFRQAVCARRLTLCSA